MPDQFSFLVRIALVTFVVTVLWAASIAFTYWDTHRQHLAERKTFIWFIVVALLPFFGFIAYIFFRALSLLLPSRTIGKSPSARRQTALKPPQLRRMPMPTINASDMDMQVLLDPKKTGHTNAVRSTITAKYILTIASGAGSVKEFILENLPATIGRGSGASIRLDGDLGVSRKQAEIYEQAGLLMVRDLKSAHGTQVNGIRIDDTVLESGDRIQVGSTVLLIKIIKE